MGDWKRSLQQTYLTNQSGAASFNGAWIDCRIGELVIWEIYWAAFAGCAGSLALQGTQDTTTVPAAARIITIPALASGIYGVWPTIGATADIGVAMIKSPFLRMRVACTITGAGTANQFQGTVEIRN